MSLRDDPRYFPQPDVPNNGNYGSSFGREQLYYGYSPRSAAIDTANEAAGEKTYSSGKYTFDSATGQYTWVPAGSTIKKDTAADYKSGLRDGEGGPGGDYGGGSGVGGGSFSRDPNSLTGGLLAGLIGSQAPAPVVEGIPTMSPYGFNPYAGDPDMGYSPGTPNSVSRDSDTAESGNVDGGGNRGGSAMAPEQGLAAVSAQAQTDSGDFGLGYGEGAAAPGGGGGGGEGLGAGYDKANGGVVGRFAHGGLGSLGGYSDGDRLLRGPGDGVSDSIPATIGKAKRPARLADGEFVVPARIVSELGNGSTAAGARKLYAMLARIQAGRKKSIGKSKVAVNSRMDKHLPA